MYPSWERISEIMLVWHTTMAYRISFLYPLLHERRENGWKNGEGGKREREEKKERASPVNMNCIRTHWRISQTRRRHFPLFREIRGVSATGVSEMVNYHPLNNGAVYEFRHHVAPARSLRPTEALGTATSLLNFLSASRRERETRRGESWSQPL